MPTKYLQKITFLKRLPDSDLKRVIKIAKIQSFPKGSFIFRQEESGNQLFVVLSGLVKIFFTSSSRRRKTVAMLLPGDFFGEMALLDGKVRSANAMAAKPSKILAINKNDFKRLLMKDPDLTFVVLRTLCDRLRKADDQIRNLIFKNVHGRVVKTLVDMASEGKQGDGGLLLSQPMTRQELAEIVGTTREPVTRSLGMLRRAGLIDYQDKSIIIKDIERMKGLV